MMKNQIADWNRTGIPVESCYDEEMSQNSPTAPVAAKTIENPPLPAPSFERRVSLKDKAYEELKRRILSGELAGGCFLSERQVASWLGMSKTPIQAAFQRLDSEGLVRISPQQGVVVHTLTLQEGLELFELRFALETYVVRSLSERITPSQIDELRRQLDAQHDSAIRGEVDQNVELDRTFHLTLCEMLGNREISRVMWHLRDKIHRAVRDTHSRAATRLNEIPEEHALIVDALAARQGEVAAARMTVHLESSRRLLTHFPSG